MRILHFSDLHIGVENYGRIDPQTGLSTRLLDFLSTLDEVVEYALGENVDLVLFAGDAYKSRDPSQTHQRELAKRLARLSSAGIPIFLLVGNHDLPHAIGKATAIEIFHTLQVPNIYVGDELKTYLVPTLKGPLQIVALPWPNRSKLLTREESRGLNIEQIRQEIERRLSEGVQLLAQRLDPATPAVLAGHVTVNGAETGSEQSMMLGRDHVITLSTLKNPAFDYVALGHIHKHQEIGGGSPMVVYSGSTQRVDFSEEEDKKGFCVIDLDPSSPQGRKLKNFYFQPVKARPFLTIKVTVPIGDTDSTETVRRAILRHHIKDAIVRLQITLPAELEVYLTERELYEALKDAHFVAAINLEVEKERRTRISTEGAEKMGPLDALRLYLESRKVSLERQGKLIQYARQLVYSEDV